MFCLYVSLNWFVNCLKLHCNVHFFLLRNEHIHYCWSVGLPLLLTYISRAVNVKQDRWSITPSESPIYPLQLSTLLYWIDLFVVVISVCHMATPSNVKTLWSHFWLIPRLQRGKYQDIVHWVGDVYPSRHLIVICDDVMWGCHAIWICSTWFFLLLNSWVLSLSSNIGHLTIGQSLLLCVVKLEINDQV